MVERMTALLDAFDAASPRLTLAELAERTGLPRSSAHRILDRLVALRWLDHSGQSYALGMRALELGGLAVAHHELRDIAAPLLADLHQRTGAVACLAVVDRRDVVYIDRVGRGLSSDGVTRVGGRAPAHATAAGKAILAWIDDSVLRATYPPRLPIRTPSTITTLDALRQDLAQARSRGGVAYERDELAQGTVSVAVALRGTGQALAALQVSGETGPPTWSVSRPSSRKQLAGRRERCSPPRHRGDGRGPSTAHRDPALGLLEHWTAWSMASAATTGSDFLDDFLVDGVGTLTPEVLEDGALELGLALHLHPVAASAVDAQIAAGHPAGRQQSTLNGSDPVVATPAQQHRCLDAVDLRPQRDVPGEGRVVEAYASWRFFTAPGAVAAAKRDSMSSSVRRRWSDSIVLSQATIRSRVGSRLNSINRAIPSDGCGPKIGAPVPPGPLSSSALTRSGWSRVNWTATSPPMELPTMPTF